MGRTAIKTSKKSEKVLNKELTKLFNWKTNSKQTNITQTFVFTNYIESLTFLAKISVHAEVIGHHPDVLISKGKVKITLTTHDSKCLTGKDFVLAEKIDSIYRR